MKSTSLCEERKERRPVAQADQEEMVVGGMRNAMVEKHVLVESRIRLEQTLEPSCRHVQTTNALVVGAGVQVVVVLAVEQASDGSTSHPSLESTPWKDGIATCFPAPKCLASRPPARLSTPRRFGEEATRTREVRPCRPPPPAVQSF